MQCCSARRPWALLRLRRHLVWRPHAQSMEPQRGRERFERRFGVGDGSRAMRFCESARRPWAPSPRRASVAATTGLRPTFGRVSRAGGMALCWSLDKVGPICRGAEDTAMVLSVLNGGDPGPDRSSIDAPFAFAADASLTGLRIGYLPEAFGAGATPVDHAALETMRGLGLSRRRGGTAGPTLRRPDEYPLCRGRCRLRGTDPLGSRRYAHLAGARRLAEHFPQGALPLRRGSRAARPPTLPGHARARPRCSSGSTS